MLTIPTAAIGFYSRKAYELGDTFTQLRYNKSLYKYWFDQHYNSDGTIK